jgi:putative RNA 2'-phosphotransferase
MDKRTRHRIISLAKFLNYVLSQRPDEFGLVPDQEGFVSLKELLQAVNEEEGWRYVRRSHVQEIFWSQEHPGLQIMEGRIRAAPAHHFETCFTFPPSRPPKLLYYGASRRAYPHILEQGLKSAANESFRLSTSREMALRIARRKDPQPIILEVFAEKAWERGISFRRVNELIFLVESLSPDLFFGPPPPKEREKPVQRKAEKVPPLPGSFFLDMSKSPQGLLFPGKPKSPKTQKGKHTKMDRREARRLKRSE